MKITNKRGSRSAAKRERNDGAGSEGKKQKREARNKTKKVRNEREGKKRALQNINSSRVKGKRIGKTFSGKRKSISQAVKLGGSSKWIRLRECVR